MLTQESIMNPQDTPHILSQILKVVTSLQENNVGREPLLSEEMPLGSPEQNKLFEALAKAQSEMKPAIKDSTNPFFKSKYADWSSIIKASREALTKYGLSVSQVIIDRENGQKYLYTKVGHASGQFIASRVKVIPPKPDPQSLGATITYLKRYSYSTLVGVSDPYEDDDGEALMEAHRSEQVKPAVSHVYEKKIDPIVQESSYVTLSHDQYDMINDALKEHPVDGLIEDIKKAYRVETLADLPRKDFKLIHQRILDRRSAATKE